MLGNDRERQNILEKTVKLFDLTAGTGRLYRLTYPSLWLVPLEVSTNDENATFRYNLDGLKSISSINKSIICEKLRLLLNISGLLNISDEYSFSLNPENLYIDRNLEPKILFRDLNGEDNCHDFLKEYKALIGCLLNPRYKFEDYIKGGGSLYKKKKVLRPLLKADTVEDIEKALKEKYDHEFKIVLTEKALVNRSRHRLMRILTPILIFLILISCGFTAYIGFVSLPFQKILLESEHAFLRGDYDNAIDALKNINPEKMPKEERYQLARAYVISESLSKDQKDNILTGIKINTEDNILFYWIHIGRMEYESAIDMANRIGSDELLLYALVSYEVYVQNDATLTGEEKTNQLSQINGQISTIENAILDKEKIIEEESQNILEQEQEQASENALESKPEAELENPGEEGASL